MCSAILLLLALSDSPQFQARVQEGLAALQQNNLPLAQRSFEQATRLSPNDAKAWFLLAQSYARQDNMKAALPAAAKASQSAGKDATILFNLTVFYRDARQPDLAIGTAKRALLTENSAELRALLAQAYAAKKDWPNAVAQYSEVLKLSPYSEEAIFNLAQAHLQARDFPRAVAVLEEGRKTFDKSPQIELSLGVAYYGLRRFNDAVDRYLRVMELSPDTPQPYYFVGRILEHALDRIPKIIAHAAYFEKQHPKSPLGFLLHAKALVLQLPSSGFPAEAEQAYGLLQRAEALDEKQAETQYLLGTLLERKQDYAAAALRLERSIQADPRLAAAHFRLARVYDKLGRREEAAAQRALHEKLSAEEGGGKPQ
ncbi:MAG TPA: tetratricopeptide repeat protein [Paludibaculum sp.]|jgi:tetratricopeptide (TPR) repeat protein